MSVKQDRDIAQLGRIQRECIWFRQEMAQRLAESKRLFKRKVVAVDPHTHSVHSDGTGTLEENRNCAMQAGLDFLFATDHETQRHKRGVAKWSDVSWGQEPGAGAHHIGLLNGTRLFKPSKKSIAQDFERARAIAPFVWIAHPTGWYPTKVYCEKQIETLWTLGEAFAMEVMNGANHLFRSWDVYDRNAVAVWDRLLLDGRRIQVLGASDAHGPDDIGCAWTGVLGAKPTAESIIKGLNAGRCFASEASLLDFSIDGNPMGSVLKRNRGNRGQETHSKSRIHIQSPLSRAKIALQLRVADAAGISKVRVVANDRAVKEYDVGGATFFEETLACKLGKGWQYYRIETLAVDARRAFSSPIYVDA